MLRLIGIFLCAATVLLVSPMTDAANEQAKKSQPTQYGAIVYSMNIKRLADFYVSLFDMQVIRKTGALISLEKQGFNLIIHTPPYPLPQETFNPVKLFLTVDSMQNTRVESLKLGGSVLEGEWKNPIFKVSNIVDPDGNHIQIREFF